MDVTKHGQRLLMALTSLEDQKTAAAGSLSLVDGVLITVGGLLCLMLAAVLCVCGERKPKSDTEDSHQKPRDIELNNVEVPMDGDTSEPQSKPLGETSGEMNGGQAHLGSPSGHTDHKRQASSGSGPPSGIRPTSLRELPEPPVRPRHSRNTSMSGVELPPVPDSEPSGSERGMGEDAAANNYAYPKHVSPRGARSGSTKVAGVGEIDKVKSHSDGYDHLGQKPQNKPTNYDSLLPGEREDGERSPLSETGRGPGNHHYSLVRERTYDVVKDVKSEARKIYDPYSMVSDKDDPGEESYRASKEEDPYNQIGDSGGGVRTSFIRHLRESSDSTDPYATVQDESGGDLKSLSQSSGTGASSSSKTLKPAPSSSHGDGHNDYEVTDDDEEEEEEAEYAVVHKMRGKSDRRPPTSEASGGVGARSSHTSSDDYSASGPMPPEPPRLYNEYEDEDETYSVTSPSGEKKEHKYSKVTARESLASMSARNALNPYELVQDIPENTYATVEGGSGDGIVLRHVDSDDNNSNRNSQNSDTYAEIAISGGGMTTTIISNSGSSAHNTSGSQHSTGGGGGSGAATASTSLMNTSASSGAPDPPSLDSLHLMTKSQTSSEGDRLSDRHLASPEDSGLDAVGFPHLPAWGSRSLVDADEDSGGSVAEDGYSTLKRVVEGSSGGRDAERGGGSLLESPVQASSSSSSRRFERPAQLTITDAESGEVTQLSPDYTTVKDCLSKEDLRAEMENDNDPNYESVDEARAKLHLLYRTERMVADEKDGGGGGSSEISSKNNVTVVKVLHSMRTSTTSSSSSSVVTRTTSSGVHNTPPNNRNPNSLAKESEISNNRPDSNRPKRRPNHDYEEVDLSPPTSPSTPSVSSPSSRPTQSPTLPSPRGVASPNESLAEAKQRLVRSHMYEDISEVRQQSSKFSQGPGTSTVGLSPPSSSPSSSQTHPSALPSSRRPSLPVPSSSSQPSTPAKSKTTSASSHDQKEKAQDTSSSVGATNGLVGDVGANGLRALVNSTVRENVYGDKEDSTKYPTAGSDVGKANSGTTSPYTGTRV